MRSERKEQRRREDSKEYLMILKLTLSLLFLISSQQKEESYVKLSQLAERINYSVLNSDRQLEDIKVLFRLYISGYFSNSSLMTGFVASKSHREKCYHRDVQFLTLTTKLRLLD